MEYYRALVDNLEENKIEEVCSVGPCIVFTWGITMMINDDGDDGDPRQ